MKKAFIILWILLMVFVLANSHYSKPDISDATYQEVLAIKGIGEKLAKDIVDYIDSNDLTDINKLKFDTLTQTGVKYIGRKRLKLLKKHFK